MNFTMEQLQQMDKEQAIFDAIRACRDDLSFDQTWEIVYAISRKKS